MMATHEVAAARKAADELFKIAEELEAPFLRAGAAYAKAQYRSPRVIRPEP